MSLRKNVALDFLSPFLLIETFIKDSVAPMNRVAVYAGSFDPLTLGHLDVIERVAPLFDKLILLVAKNNAKKSLFSLTERQALVAECLASRLPVGSFEIHAFEGLTVNFCLENNAKVLIRGLRALSDFEKEFQMAAMNRHLSSEVETLHIMTDEKYFFVSSSLVKEVAEHGGSLSHLVPENIEKALQEKYRSKKQ